MSEKLPKEIYYWKNGRPRPYAALHHLKAGIRARSWWRGDRVYVAKIVEWVDVTDEIIDEKGWLK